MRANQIAVLEATLRLIVRDGAQAVRYRDVAAESGVPLGTISYQYPTREHLLRAAFEHYLASSETALLQHAAKSRPRTPEQLAALVVEVVRAEVTSPDKVLFAEHELLLYATRAAVVAKALAQWNRKVIAGLGALVEHIGGTTPFATAQTIVDLCRGFELLALTQPAPDFDDFALRAGRLLADVPLRPTQHEPKPDPSPLGARARHRASLQRR